MSIAVTPHLNFRGDAREALTFYHGVFGGDLVVTTYADMGHVPDPAEADLVVWGQVEAPDGFRVMAFDVPAARPFERGIASSFVSLRGTEPAEVADRWSRLADGATILQPLAEAQWSPLYGMLTDRFGITWVVDVAVEWPSA